MTQVGGGAALLAASGVGTQVAIDFALSAQALLIFAGAAVVIVAGLSHLVTRRRRGGTPDLGETALVPVVPERVAA